MALQATPCAYHPGTQATNMCERCRRPICVNDQRVYRRRRSRSRGYYQWTEEYLYCIACNAEQLSLDANGSLVFSIIFLVILFVILGNSGFAIFIALIAILLAFSIISSRSKAKKAQREKQMLLSGATQERNVITNETLSCFECGNRISRRSRYCTACGDSTKDELKASYN